jgi:hypothetical protein
MPEVPKFEVLSPRSRSPSTRVQHSTMAIEEVFDYIVSIPELDAYGLEHIDTAKHQVKLTVRGAT